MENALDLFDNYSKEELLKLLKSQIKVNSKLESKANKLERKQEISGLRMRSAISREGYRSHYARAAYDGHYLSCPFSPFRVKTSF